jgi:hypothetical protein
VSSATKSIGRRSSAYGGSVGFWKGLTGLAVLTGLTAIDVDFVDEVGLCRQSYVHRIVDTMNTHVLRNLVQKYSNRLMLS